jgi:hypothetical protein
MRTTLILAVTALACVGCNRGRSSDTMAARSGEDRSTGEAMVEQLNERVCAIQVPGTSVGVEETEAGSSVVFQTSGDVEELQDRVEREASIRDASPRNGITEVPANVEVENTEDGARMEITSEDPDRVEELRQDVERHVAAMRESGTCTPG